MSSTLLLMFISLAIFPLIYELRVLCDVRVYVRNHSLQKEAMAFGLFYTVWCIMGAIITTNWILFLDLIFLGFFTKKTPTSIKIDAIISIIILLVIIFDTLYKLHIFDLLSQKMSEPLKSIVTIRQNTSEYYYAYSNELLYSITPTYWFKNNNIFSVQYFALSAVINEKRSGINIWVYK